MARNPKQDANLKPPFDSNQNREEASKNGRKGGKRSGEVRRAKRTAREAAQRLLAMSATGKMRDNLIDLGYDPDDLNGIENIDVIVARLMVLAASGKIEAADKLLKIAGYDAEENRAERESINADRRRELELEAKVAALGQGRASEVAMNLQDESGENDVVIYMPQIASEEDCEMKPESADLEGPVD